ncbi:YscJ/HrcJ family type III secretion apparatus lipoprotein [Burkholderia ubonensis]|uniref:type III secretion system inner membrane ring lipoprotein SctJ n=1 Tax=Burkholderia ubonensis TaxID=101571 RepID=UPI00075789D8|nr:type III secretion inner membrane ring lipoprotein SctJ [Burkholderia ubonensis]KWI31341.1 YscJ/HrcJ family type III secretion apparatus lipoprotein [Burkholderia ubonensis]OJB15011.1 EscJ/YscJ/HrcJ family type III secretion inner membrane ring protein [Burkholderia ubonensis]
MVSRGVRSVWPRAIRVTGAALTCVVLAACRTSLYENLSEQDANEMIAALFENGIDASKQRSGNGKHWMVLVRESEFAGAVEVLRDRGLPQEKRDDLGNLFRKDGLVSTPTEERVRFLYGLSQELSSTMSAIDGVIVARVQIVLPNNDPLAQEVKPSSASVFIKYNADSSVGKIVPQIKTLVVNSVEGLTYERVSVTAVAAEPAARRAVSPNRLPLAWMPAALAALGLAGALSFMLMRSGTGARLREWSRTRLGRLRG